MRSVTPAARRSPAGITGEEQIERASSRAPGLSARRWGTACAVPLTIVAVSLLAQLSPPTQALLEFDRAAIAAGQWWRLVTGNLVHYSWAHWAANVGAFAALCWMACGRSRGTAGVVLVSAPAVGGGVFLFADAVGTYRGISGIDCALLAWVLATMAVQDAGWKTAGWLSALALVGAKTIYEAATGRVLLPTSAPAGVEVVSVTHVVGLLTGVLAIGLAFGAEAGSLMASHRFGGACYAGRPKRSGT